MNPGNKYIECDKCHKRFDSRLTYLWTDIEKKSGENLEIFTKAFKEIIIKLSIADKKIGEKEKVKIRKIYGEATGKYYAEEEMFKDMRDMHKTGAQVSTYVNNIKDVLTPDGLAFLMRSAILVSIADGKLNTKEQAMLKDLAEALNLPPDKLEAMVKAVIEGMKKQGEYKG
ncbi:MAG: TerB family tellurite resistance protein [Spirochaetales bacterium]|nr:TerB family tellurite resistance protein [Spirochaetales bacterium]